MPLYKSEGSGADRPGAWHTMTPAEFASATLDESRHPPVFNWPAGFVAGDYVAVFEPLDNPQVYQLVYDDYAGVIRELWIGVIQAQLTGRIRWYRADEEAYLTNPDYYQTGLTHGDIALLDQGDGIIKVYVWDFVDFVDGWQYRATIGAPTPPPVYTSPDGSTWTLHVNDSREVYALPANLVWPTYSKPVLSRFRPDDPGYTPPDPNSTAFAKVTWEELTPGTPLVGLLEDGSSVLIHNQFSGRKAVQNLGPNVDNNSSSGLTWVSVYLPIEDHQTRLKVRPIILSLDGYGILAQGEWSELSDPFPEPPAAPESALSVELDNTGTGLVVSIVPAASGHRAQVSDEAETLEGAYAEEGQSSVGLSPANYDTYRFKYRYLDEVHYVFGEWSPLSEEIALVPPTLPTYDKPVLSSVSYQNAECVGLTVVELTAHVGFILIQVQDVLTGTLVGKGFFDSATPPHYLAFLPADVYLESYPSGLQIRATDLLGNMQGEWSPASDPYP